MSPNCDPAEAGAVPPRSHLTRTPEQWVRRHVSPLTLDVGRLDHSAEEIIATLTAHADVPVDHYAMPAASDERVPKLLP
jgi:hypothetical protein